MFTESNGNCLKQSLMIVFESMKGITHFGVGTLTGIAKDVIV